MPSFFFWFSSTFSSGFGTASFKVRTLCQHFASLPNWFLSQGSSADACVKPWNNFVSENNIDCSGLCLMFKDLLKTLDEKHHGNKSTHDEVLRSLINIMGASDAIRNLLYVGKKMVTRISLGKSHKVPMLFIGLSSPGPVLRDRVNDAFFTIFMSGTLPSFYHSLLDFGLNRITTQYSAEDISVNNQTLKIVGTDLKGTRDHTRGVHNK